MAGIDTSIYGLVRTPKTHGPLDQYAQAMTVGNLVNQGKLQDMQLRSAERGEQDTMALRDLFRRGNVKPEEIDAISPEKGQAYRKGLLETQKGEADLAKVKADTERTKVQTLKDNAALLRDQLAAVANDGQLRALRDNTVRLFGPEAASDIPQTVGDPNFNAWRQQNLMTADKLIISAEARLADERARTEGALGRGVTMRGQNLSAQTTIRGQDMADARTRETAAAKAKEIPQVVNAYVQARDGLMSGLGGSTTGPVAGHIPAVTTEQQIAEGGVAAMAPVLKQLFRSAGEGVFTDRDQALLMDMIPKRTDTAEARKAKMENIDRIVSAKLGTQVPAYSPGARTGQSVSGGIKFLGFESTGVSP